MSTNTVSPHDVPQATLARVRTVVDACAHGATTPERMQAKTGVSPRHVSYALAAAKSLGLIHSSRGALHLTPLGERLAGTVPSSEEERLSFVQAVSESEALRAIAPGLLGPAPLDTASLTEHITKVSGLSVETAAHRAAMILQWRAVLLEPQLRLFREP